MAGDAKTHDLDGELGDLWFARATLDDAGWKRLYVVVCGLLMSYRPQELASLVEDREIYVQEFFCEKVLRPDAEPARIHVGALKFFYRNFLKDRIRELATYREHFSSIDGDGEEGGGGLSVDSQPCASGCPGEDSTIAALAEHGLGLAEVSRSAREFLAAQEDWVPVYLAFSFCPDADKEEPLIHLAARKGIKSHHYKASALGINWKQGKGDKSFSETKIGRWLEEDLGIGVDYANRGAMDAAFKILCFEALSWRESDEARNEA